MALIGIRRKFKVKSRQRLDDHVLLINMAVGLNHALRKPMNLFNLIFPYKAVFDQLCQYSIKDQDTQQVSPVPAGQGNKPQGVGQW